MGQNQYATLTLASNAALTEITTIESIPLPEHKAIASFVIQTNSAYTNSVKSRVRVLDSGASFIDWRFAQVGGAGASGTGGNVVGPVGATDGDIALFNGATGTLIKDGGTPVAVVGTAIHAAANKTTPTGADEIAFTDSASAFALAKVTVTNLVAYLSALASAGWNTATATLAATATNAINVTTTIASAVTGTTQAVNDNSTKIATTAYADRLPVLGTAQATTSGTSIDFVIPTWARKVTLMFNAVSTNGASALQVQLGTGGVPTTTGYVAGAEYLGTSTVANQTATTGFLQYGGNATDARYGMMVFTHMGSNIWVCNGSIYNSNGTTLNVCAGGVTLAGAINLLRLTTINGTDVFDGGSVNDMYE